MRLVLTPPSPPKKWWNMMAAVATSSPMPKVIIANAVPRCLAAIYPNTMPKPRPASAERTGINSKGTGSLPAPAASMKWIVQ